jgi:TusA-related sulfurtransferase
MKIQVVNSLGKRCPIPIIEVSTALAQLESGEMLQLQSDDPATWPDLQAWGRMTGNEVSKVSSQVFHIVKK